MGKALKKKTKSNTENLFKKELEDHEVKTTPSVKDGFFKAVKEHTGNKKVEAQATASSINTGFTGRSISELRNELAQAKAEEREIAKKRVHLEGQLRRHTEVFWA